MRSFAAFSLLFLTTCASVSAFVTFPLKRHQGSDPSRLESIEYDNRARAALLKSRAASDLVAVPILNTHYVNYTTHVGIGDPPTYYNLAIDTGTAISFVGTGKKQYVNSSTSVATGQGIEGSFEKGGVYAAQYLDQVTLAPNLVINNQLIGVVETSATQSDYIDGVLALGRADLSLGSVVPNVDEVTPTVMDNLASQGLIDRPVFSIYFTPKTKEDATSGKLIYGGVDESLIVGELTYVALTTTKPASAYWGINISSCIYGSKILFSASTAGVVNTASTQILLAHDFFESYMNAIPGAQVDSKTGLIEIPESSISSMSNLNFEIGGRVFALDVSAQLIPTHENEAWGGEAGKRYGVVGNAGNPSGGGSDFVIGQKFMERYYTVFDAESKRIGFAETNHTWTPSV